VCPPVPAVSLSCEAVEQHMRRNADLPMSCAVEPYSGLLTAHEGRATLSTIMNCMRHIMIIRRADDGVMPSDAG